MNTIAPNETPRPALDEALVSVVLPVYNEADVLERLAEQVIDTLDETGVEWELIFVNDGSTDGGDALLDRMAHGDARVRVIHLSRNFGHQAAVQAGLTHAMGDAVVLMDSDMQDAPSAIPRFLEQWQAGADVVYAVRRHRKEHVLKRLAFAAFHRLMARTASVRIPVDAGNFGLIDRRVLDLLLSMPERDRYFPGLRSWVGFRQVGVDVERGERYDHRPRVSLFGLLRLAKTALFSFSTFPLAVFHAIGAVATGVFVLLAAYALGTRLLTDWAVPGWTSYVLVGSFFGSLNALGICVLGEYVLRIYDQVRCRPMYVIARSLNTPDESLGGDPFDEEWTHEEWLERRLEADELLEAKLGASPLDGQHDAPWLDPWLDEDGDTPYVELMREAMDLLERGGFIDPPNPPQDASTPDAPASDAPTLDEPVASIRFPGK